MLLCVLFGHFLRLGFMYPDFSETCSVAGSFLFLFSRHFLLSVALTGH